ncbi:serine protease [Kitasatospora sp. NPDC050543]|uniref:serine protease n=1 Tax=Kitasatospora sp. NPDC050543 TaxID=3364054 RepID=UPI0037B77E3D
MAGGPEGAAEHGRALLRIRALDGRLRGLGFLADPQGTVLTAHETVAGLERLVLHTPGGQTRVLGPDSVHPLPEQGLALLRTDGVGGLPVPALSIAAPATGRPVLLPQLPGDDQERPVLLGGALLGTGTGLYSWEDGFHLVEGVLLLDLPLPHASLTPGTPVLDAENGAVLGVLAPGLRSPQRAGAVAVAPWLAAAGGGSPVLAQLLGRNAAGVPGHGRALNLGGVLQLASAQLGAAGAGPGRIADLAADRVDRPDGLTGEEPQALVTALVGAPGSGRSTELAALAVRRAGGPRPLPTLWLRGADLRPADRSLADAVGRALEHAAGLLAGQLPPTGPEPQAAPAARLCAAGQRPLLVVLDGPEEAPLAAGGAWLPASVQWLQECGARLLTACGPELWEQLAAQLAAAPAPASSAGGTAPEQPVVHRLGPLPEEAADRARRRYGLPVGWLAPADARHPLALRLAGELWAEGVRGGAPGRAELFEARLDLGCLRVAQRIAQGEQPRRPGAHRRGGQRGPGADHGRVRRLAAAVAGRLHEAARRTLGPGEGGLARADFEELFPVAGGWAAAVLAERLFVPAGAGYRPAHQESADWWQGLHLDLDEALRLLLAEEQDACPAWWPGAGPEAARRPAATPGAATAGVARHRIGPVVAALRRLGRTWGAPALDPWLHRIWRALDLRPAGSEPAWWAGRLLAAGLAASPDPAEHRALLEQLAERIAERAGVTGGFGPGGEAGFAGFGPGFWTELGLPPALELDLLRRLARADGPGQPFLGAVAGRLRVDAPGVLPLLCAWLADSRSLPALPGRSVADLAHDLLYAHRALALDDLTECLADAAHPRADALLGLLAAEEPSALCRAVDRWSHDPRPERHVAAAVHAQHAAPHARGQGPALLRFTAQALLAREDEPALHGAALALLVLDRETRGRYLPDALAAYGRADPFVTAAVLAPALESDPEPVLAALGQRPAGPGAEVAQVLRVLAGAVAPAACRRGVVLVGRLLRERPELAALIAAEYLERRLEREPPAAGTRAELRTLLEGEPARGSAVVRRAFARVLATPGQALRRELLESLLAAERDPLVLTAVLERLADDAERHESGWLRAVVARVGAVLATADEELLRCAGRSAAFAELLAWWPPDAGLPAPGGPLVARMRGLVVAGRDPQEAAARARRPARGPARAAAGIPVPEQGRAHGTL